MTTQEVMALADQYADECTDQILGQDTSGVFEKTRAALQSAIEALQADAQRYLYLKSLACRDDAYDRYPGYRWSVAIYDDSKVGLDAAIDAAMALDKR
jgi:hypothetical protein